MRTKLIIFDLDGILCSMTEGHRLCLNKALNEICSYEIPLELHNSTLNGLPTKIKLNYLISHDLIPATIDTNAINAKKQEYTVQYIKDNITKDAEKIKIFNYLSTQFDGNFAVYTNSIRQTAELMLESIGFWPVHLISNTDVEYPKPHPQGYQILMQYYKSLPEETVIIEDSDHGIQGALSSGGWVWGVTGVESVTLENIRKIIV